MCGRYHVDSEAENAEILAILAEAKKRAGEPPAAGEVAPSMRAAVVADAPTVASWGFASYKGSGLVINARAEGFRQSAFFRGALPCVVPASGFYEWDKAGVKYDVTAGGVVYMAGLMREGRFAVVTRPALGALLDIHPRMPLLLPDASARGDWTRKFEARMDDLPRNLSVSAASPVQLSLF